MGNISSVIGRAGEDNSRGNDAGLTEEERRRQLLTAEDFLSDAVAGLELNNHDYQNYLHLYLSQRYAERYTNTTYDYNQRLRTHETPTTTTSVNAASSEQIHQNKEPLSKNSSFNQSGDLIVLNLKGKKLKEVPLELFYHDEVTSLDLSNNGNKGLLVFVP